jgi:tripartite-type tricarboxylate transporter receptor subunit TctC
MKRNLFKAMLFLMVILPCVAGVTAWAQPYPNRPINLILPGSAGSIIDITGRILGDELGKILGQQIVPINKAGGAFTVGTDFVAKAKKDGYTLSYTNNPAIVYARILTPDTIPYDPDRDLEPLGLHLFFAHTIAVQESAPWKTFEQLLDFAKKNPGKVNINTPGIGSTAHFHLEIIQSLTGAQFNHVPFKSGEAVVTGLLGGHVDATFDAVSKLRPHMESGKVRMLLVSIKVPDLPKVPTLADLGYKQQQLVPSWFGMYGPAGLPEDVKKVLIPAIEKAVKNPELKTKIEKLDFIVEYRTPAEQKKLSTEEYESAKVIAKKIGLSK